VPNGTFTVTPSITGPSALFFPTTKSVTVNGSDVPGVNFQASLGYSVAGTINYSGSQTGRIYVSLGQYGTSIASPGAFKDYVAAKSPDAVLVLLSHDHGDHMGDYFEMLKTLVGGGLPVKTTGQSDLMRGGLVQKFKDAGLDPAQVVVNGGAAANEAELVVFERNGDEVAIEARTDATVFVMNGEPIDEPVAGYGPFVMNTPQQIQQAIADMRTGRLGKIPTLTT